MECKPNTHGPTFMVNMVGTDRMPQRSYSSRYPFSLDAEMIPEDEFELWLQQALASGVFADSPKRRKSWSPFKLPQKGIKSWRRSSWGCGIMHWGLGDYNIGKKAIVQGFMNVNRLTNNLPGWITNFCSKGESGWKRNTRTNRYNTCHCWTWFSFQHPMSLAVNQCAIRPVIQILVDLWCINFSSLGIWHGRMLKHHSEDGRDLKGCSW